MKVLTVILPVYKEPLELLDRCLVCLAKQTLVVDWQLIIILDNPDYDEAAVRKLICVFPPHISVHIEKNEQNMGLARSLNKAIALVESKYIARMDADDTCEVNRFQLQVDFLEKNKTHDLVFSQWQEINENGKVVAVRRPTLKHFLNIKNEFFRSDCLLHASLMARKELFERFKYPEMGRCEDYVLFMKMIREGVKFGLIEEVLYNYYISTDWDVRFAKNKYFAETYPPILFREIKSFYNVSSFWILLIKVLIAFPCTRSKRLFQFAYHFYLRFFKVDE